MRYTFLILLILSLGCSVEKSINTAETSGVSPVLFSIESDTVYADEFIYVYSKNNQSNDSAFTREDITEYLRLYENFKLKVHEGRIRGIDTTEAYRNEMVAYEEQLKKPYLTETKVTDQLVQEAYDRFSEEIRARHILIATDENASPADTLEAYNKISEIREMAVAGASFDSLAATYSDDPSAKNNGGDLQYFTSLQMVYPFESAAYTTPVDSISRIVRSQFGYHIIQILDRRKANNKVSVSHIMIRHDAADPDAARNKIFEVHEMATGGVDWDQLVNEYSDDPNSKRIGGRLQPFGVRQLPFEFQEAAFALEPGQVSDPVRTDFGWHVIKMEQRMQQQELQDIESTIRSRIEGDVRSEIGQQALIDRLSDEWNASMLVSPHSPVDTTANLSLFTIGDSTYTTDGYKEFIGKRGLQEGEDANYLVSDYYDESVVAYEEAHLAEKYDDYRMLLREYREGILLFQLMDQEIWSRASSDSTGLRGFYDMTSEKYMEPGMIKGTLYRIDAAETRDSLYSYVTNNAEGALEDLVRQYERDNIVTSQKAEGTPADLGIPADTEIFAGQIIMIDSGFLKIFEYDPPHVKPLEEVRGRVIADYQDSLEEGWIRQLRSSYNVILNEDGLEYVYEKLVR